MHPLRRPCGKPASPWRIIDRIPLHLFHASPLARRRHMDVTGACHFDPEHAHRARQDRP
jgi:hypothetical protein